MTDRSLPRTGVKHGARLTESDLLEALREDEAKQGRPHTPREREAFAQGFFSTEYREEVMRLAARELGRADVS